MNILQYLVDGVLDGAILALGAIGLSLSLSLHRFANFAYAEYLTWGAYAALTFLALTHLSGGSIAGLSIGPGFVAVIVLACIAVALLSLFLDALVFTPLRRRNAVKLTLIFASFGIGLILRNAVLLLYGPEPEYYTRALQMAVPIGPEVRVRPDKLLILLLAAILLVAFHLFLTRTRYGVAMRAVAENPDLAEFSGIPTEHVLRLAWMTSGALAAVSGIFFGVTGQLTSEMGFELLLPLFAAVLLGGVGSMLGAAAGALITGISGTLSLLIIPSTYKPAVPFMILLLILYFRPRGIFGKAR
jgi:branched-chain amino acid transport system permease protein